MYEDAAKAGIAVIGFVNVLLRRRDGRSSQRGMTLREHSAWFGFHKVEHFVTLEILVGCLV